MFAAAVAAVAMFANSEQARRANAADRKRINNLVNSLQDPNFNVSKIDPEDFAVLEKYSPEVADFVVEQAPELVKAVSQGAVAGRDAQMEALERYRGLGKTGEDTQSRILRDQALQAAQIQNQGQQAAIMDRFARQGQAGSGNQLVAQLMAQQAAGQNATQSSQDAANQAYNVRLDALKSGAQLGGQIRNEDIDLEAMNTDRMNAYNQRFAANKNAYNQNAADTRNQGQLFNLKTKQALGNAKYQAAQDYQNRLNDMEQQKFNNQANRINMLSGNAATNMNARTGEAQDRNNIISGAMDMYNSYEDREARKKQYQ